MKLTVNGTLVEAREGATLLEVAQANGHTIPTLCHGAGLPHQTSCFLCVVREEKTDRLLPSCSTPAEEGMVIATDDPAVAEARRQCLDLLHSEHLGDCEAPCERGCPAHMDIPAMLRALAKGDDTEACRIVLERIALPSVVGRICSAPCEKICRRKAHDGAVAICLLKRFASDQGHDRGDPEVLKSPATGKRVAVVGAGPAGLAAAYYLARRGHSVTVHDEHDEPGGTLRYEVPASKLPRDVLSQDIDRIKSLGVTFNLGQAIDADGIKVLLNEVDAVVLTTGRVDGPLAEGLGLKLLGDSLTVGPAFETSVPKLFARAIQQTRSPMAIRSLGDGYTLAQVVHGFVTTAVATKPAVPFQSIIPRIEAGDMPRYLHGQDPSPRNEREPGRGKGEGFSAEEVRAEARRCLHCDCHAKAGCHFRDQSTAQGARRDRYPKMVKPVFEETGFAHGVQYQMGKCIRCGLCIRSTEAAAISEPLAFAWRGTRMAVIGPLALPEAQKEAFHNAIRVCPTGALFVVGAGKS